MIRGRSFMSVTNKLDREQYRQVLAPKFIMKWPDGEESTTSGQKCDDFYEALTAFSLVCTTALSSRSSEDKSFLKRRSFGTRAISASSRSCVRQLARDAMETVDYSVYESRSASWWTSRSLVPRCANPKAYLVHQPGQQKPRLLGEDSAKRT